MKINNRSHLPLSYLSTDRLEDILVHKDELESLYKLYPYFYEDWANNRQAFSSEINVVSDSFIQAVIKASSKIIHLYNDLTSSGINLQIKGSWIINESIYFINSSINPSKNIFYHFSKKGKLLSYYRFMSLDSKPISFNASLLDGSNYKHENAIVYITLLSLFKKYAQVETKILKPMTRRVLDFGVKYINETKQNITLLNSTWFTTLIRSESFNVRGHFRLQPKKKDGKWTHEIIWINEYQKQGYRSEAKIINYKP